MTLAEAIEQLTERLEQANADLKESKSAGVNSPGFNQDLGFRDALQETLNLLKEIK